MKKVLVHEGERVRRGQIIGEVGLFPYSAGVVHIHLELCPVSCGDSQGLLGTEDPLARSEGCFVSGRVYPVDRLVLTYPIEC